MNGMVEVMWRPRPGKRVSTRPIEEQEFLLHLPMEVESPEDEKHAVQALWTPGGESTRVDSEHSQSESLNAEQVAGLLGVSRRTVESMARQERIPARKCGRDWRFSRDGVNKWLSDGVRRRASGKEDRGGQSKPPRVKGLLASRLHVPRQGWPDGPVSPDDWEDTEGS